MITVAPKSDGLKRAVPWDLMVRSGARLVVDPPHIELVAPRANNCSWDTYPQMIAGDALVVGFMEVHLLGWHT